jgi:scyllo-inositol 2-dehydrogenase (NAD+)
VSRIGVAVIGVGLMGRRHAENAASRIPGAALVAVCDHASDVARRVAGELGAEASSSIDALLGRRDVHAVVVASPSRFHAEHAIAALDAGKDVLVEKPMAHTLADCDRMLAAAEAARARLQVGFMRRYDPAYAEAERLVASGVLGEPRLLRAVHRDRDASDRPSAAGVRDMMFESTIHDFDLSRFLLADDIASVTTSAAALCHGGGEHGHAPTAALNAVRFVRGGLADIETYWGARYAYDVRTEVICAEGTAMVGQQQRTRLDVYTADGARHDLFPGFLERFADAYLLELTDFVAGARERRPPAVSGADGRAAVAAALAGIESFATGVAVRPGIAVRPGAPVEPVG